MKNAPRKRLGNPLRWLGGKSRLAVGIAADLPAHKSYVETCCGGAAVFWAKPRDISISEVLNDADGELINFYHVLHRRGKRLAFEVDAMPYSRALFDQVRAGRPRAAFARARRFWYLNRVCFGGRRRGATYGVQGGRRAFVLPQTVLGSLDALIARLRGVALESVDVVRLVELYDRPDTLFYVDPPYLGLSQDYACRFRPEDHDRLAAALGRIRGTFVLSYNDCRQVRRLYAGCRIRPLTTRYTIGTKSASSAARSGGAKELLITNRREVPG